MRAMLVRDLAERAFERSMPRLIEIAARAGAAAARTRPDEAREWLAIVTRAEALEHRAAQRDHQQQYRRAG
jgi:hypothetical protein